MLTMCVCVCVCVPVSCLMYIGAGYAGPITQNEFLHKMGIRQRMQVGSVSTDDIGPQLFPAAGATRQG